MDCIFCDSRLSSSDEILGRDICGECCADLVKIEAEVALRIVCTDRERGQLALDILAERHAR